MIFQVSIFLAGLAIISLGAQWLVTGASNLALRLGIRAIVVGLTVVAFATSAPEAVVSIVASAEDANQIALGNIIGSSIANIGLILGIAALVAPLKVHLETLKKELPIAIGAALVVGATALDGNISRVEGAFLLTGIIIFLTYYVRSALRDSNNKRAASGSDVSHGSYAKNIVLLLVGLACLIGGAQLMVDSAVFIAKETGLSELVIGLTIVAIGTSLPELATSMVASYRKEADLAVGNVLGSNIFNLFFVVGLLALISPVPISRSTLALDIPALIIFSISLLPLMRYGLILTRIEGALMLAGYTAFIWLLF